MDRSGKVIASYPIIATYMEGDEVPYMVFYKDDMGDLHSYDPIIFHQTGKFVQQ